MKFEIYCDESRPDLFASHAPEQDKYRFRYASAKMTLVK
jgi:hypothetical protein